MSGEYKLIKALGGIIHYAHILLHIESIVNGPSVSFSGNEFQWMREIYEWPADFTPKFDDEYRAVERGIEYALDHLPEGCDLTSVNVVVDEIGLTNVDTTDDALAFAGCLATWDALGVTGTHQPFLDSEGIHFPDK